MPDNMSSLATLLKSRIPKQPEWIYANDARWVGTQYAPLTSTSWDGDAHSTEAATLLDLSAVFGVPAGVKAVLVRLECRDSVAIGTPGNYAAVGPNTTYFWNIVCHAPGGDVKNSITAPVSCDANGDIAYRLIASGASTLDVWLEIWGYYI